ncbi:hypothetical protein [Sphingobium phenoxybenzoativorans]|uniref:hypothetical protein n=1 Tax=Sphingobium phenoxybenzoativorans TaxID=1592790 RepID=UPI00087244FA|nr:hypothetical protein [Sphingobium phenoxybenzoativorans]
MAAVDECEGAEVALLTFGSRTNANRTEPSYAFMNTILRMKRMRNVPCSVYYFKAKKNDWYFGGVEGQDDFDSSVQYIQSISKKFRKTIFLGNSMGGYAALIFGLLSEGSSILAFSAQTRFDAQFCDEIREKRWQDEYAAMREARDVKSMAVLEYMKNNPEADVNLFTGAKNSQDLAYCSEIAHYPNVRLFRFEESDHDLVHDLRSSGKLEEIIYDHVDGKLSS